MKGPKTQKKKKKISKKQPSTVSEVRVADAEKPFDFGGIPDRDLKKNLGCG